MSSRGERTPLGYHMTLHDTIAQPSNSDNLCFAVLLSRAFPYRKSKVVQEGRRIISRSASLCECAL